MVFLKIVFCSRANQTLWFSFRKVAKRSAGIAYGTFSETTRGYETRKRARYEAWVWKIKEQLQRSNGLRNDQTEKFLDEVQITFQRLTADLLAESN